MGTSSIDLEQNAMLSIGRHPFRTRGPKMTPTYWLLGAISRPVVWSWFGLRVAGGEHLPQGGGFVLSSNHLSGFDAWALSAPLYPRQPRFMVKSELFRRPFRRLLGSIGLFPVCRGLGGVAAVGTAAGHASAGCPVLIFPEGARRRNGRGDPPKTGAVRVALAAAVPLIPAAIAGTDGSGRWRVVFGPRVELDDLAVLPPDVAAREGTARLWQTVTALEATL